MVDILCFEKSDNDPDQDQFAPFRNVDQIDLHIIDDRPMVNEMMMMVLIVALVMAFQLEQKWDAT